MDESSDTSGSCRVRWWRTHWGVQVAIAAILIVSASLSLIIRRRRVRQAPHPTLQTGDASDQRPVPWARNSLVSSAKRNTDGTLLVKMKPHVYPDEDRGGYMMNGDGHCSLLQEYIISFTIGGQDHYMRWGSTHGTPGTIQLERREDYSFLLKPENKPDLQKASIPCTILAVWEGDRLILDKREGAKEPEASVPSRE